MNLLPYTRSHLSLQIRMYVTYQKCFNVQPLNVYISGMDIPHRAWSGTAGMSRVKDDVLIAWDSCGDILQIIDISTGSFTYKTGL